MLTTGLNSSLHSKMPWTKAYMQCWFMSGDSSSRNNAWGYHPCGGDNCSGIGCSWVNTLLQLLFTGTGQMSDPGAVFPQAEQGAVTSPTSPIPSFPVSKSMPKKNAFTALTLHGYGSQFNPLFPCIKLSSVCKAMTSTFIRRPDLSSTSSHITLHKI